MDTKTLPSGAKLGLQLADFEDGMELYQTIARELVGSKIIPEGIGSFTPETVRQVMGQNIEGIKDAALRLLSSREVTKMVRKCMTSCTYLAPGAAGEPIRVDGTTFSDAKTRPDFLPVAGEVMVYNLVPFFVNLRSLFSDLAGPSKESLQK